MNVFLVGPPHKTYMIDRLLLRLSMVQGYNQLPVLIREAITIERSVIIHCP
jgi:hypothetical protein